MRIIAGKYKGLKLDSPKNFDIRPTSNRLKESLFSIIESKRSNGEDWLIFIISDHGGDGKGHSDGQDNPCISNTVFFAQHPNLQFKSNQLSSQVDLTPSILDFMGINSQEFNCKTDGNSIFQ